ncbi:hypothetical protein [Arthrobacter pigmenti]
MEFDEGVVALEALSERTESRESRSDLNEAETRFHIIDSVLTDVLQWPRPWIHVEQQANKGYTDYELGETGTILIVEAKKEGKSFTLPSDVTAGVHKIRPLVSDSKNAGLKEAMNQVIGYCATRGVAQAMVTNGHQWVCFLASRTDGTAPLDGKALVFPSLACIASDFLTFWRHFGPEGITSQRLYGTLSISHAAPPHPLSATIHNYPRVKQRNAIQSNLQILGELVLEDFPTNPAYAELFLTECYAASGALSNYAEVSRELLTSRYALVADNSGAIIEPVQTKKGTNPELAKDAAAAALSDRPVVLLGSVGAGKSTFIQRLMRVEARDVFENALTFLVNYGQEGVIDNLSHFTTKEIERQLRDKHSIDIYENKFVEDLYRSDLRRFDSGIYGQLKENQPDVYQIKRIEFLQELTEDRSSHIARAFERIASSRRKQIVVFLDNVDQRSREDQNSVFLVSNEIAAKWPATVFVSLRPETYYESERYGAASGYHPRIFTIAPPRTDTMLQKRVDFGLKILDSPGTGPIGQVGLSSENLEDFLRMLSANFATNYPLIQMIENVAGGNMRRALDFVTQFIGSGRLDTEKIINIQRQFAGGYTIPRHEFLRSLLHGDGIYYDPKESPLPNLFQVSHPNKADHFTLPLLLDFLSRNVGATSKGGYISRHEVVAYMQNLGFKVDSILAGLQYCARHRLVEGPRLDTAIDEAGQCRPTTVGIYSLKRLPSLFAYVDPIIVDTPILDAEHSARIRDVFSLEERLNRVEIFREYLDGCWKTADILTQGWSWPATSKELSADVDLVRQRALGSKRRNSNQ